MKVRTLGVPLVLIFLTSCGGGSGDEAMPDQNDAPTTPDINEEQPEPVPEPISRPNDMNGNGLLDGLESEFTGGPDIDGDAIDDRVDADFARFSSDDDANGVGDDYERPHARDDIDNNGVADFSYPPVNGSGAQKLPLDPFKGNNLLVLNFEDGTAETNHDVPVKRPVAEDAITVDRNESRSGNYSLKTLLRIQDNYITNNAHRAESSTNRTQFDDIRYGGGQKRRYEFSLYIDPASMYETIRSDEIIWQFKNDAGSGTPDMIVVIEGAAINMRFARNLTPIVDGIDPNNLNVNTDPRINLFKFYRVGEWMDFRFDINFAADDSGSVKAFVRYASEENYRNVGEYNGRNLTFDNNQLTYLKWGNYKPIGKNSLYPDEARIVRHDDIRVYSLD